MSGEGEEDVLGLLETGSLSLLLLERPFRFLALGFLPCSCSFSACFARTEQRQTKRKTRLNTQNIYMGRYVAGCMN